MAARPKLGVWCWRVVHVEDEHSRATLARDGGADDVKVMIYSTMSTNSDAMVLAMANWCAISMQAVFGGGGICAAACQSRGCELLNRGYPPGCFSGSAGTTIFSTRIFASCEPASPGGMFVLSSVAREGKPLRHRLWVPAWGIFWSAISYAPKQINVLLRLAACSRHGQHLQRTVCGRGARTRCHCWGSAPPSPCLVGSLLSIATRLPAAGQCRLIDTRRCAATMMLCVRPFDRIFRNQRWIISKVNTNKGKIFHNQRNKFAWAGRPHPSGNTSCSGASAVGSGANGCHADSCPFNTQWKAEAVWQGLLDMKHAGQVRVIDGNFDQARARGPRGGRANSLQSMSSVSPVVVAGTIDLVAWCQMRGIVVVHTALGGSGNRAQGSCGPDCRTARREQRAGAFALGSQPGCCSHPWCYQCQAHHR